MSFNIVSLAFVIVKGSLLFNYVESWYIFLITRAIEFVYLMNWNWFCHLCKKPLTRTVHQDFHPANQSGPLTSGLKYFWVCVKFSPSYFNFSILKNWLHTYSIILPGVKNWLHTYSIILPGVKKSYWNFCKMKNVALL